LLPTYDNLCKIYQEGCISGSIELIIENHPLAPASAPSMGVTGAFLQRWIREFPELLRPVLYYSDEQEEEMRVDSLAWESWHGPAGVLWETLQGY
jgi:hypothetical protein